MWVWTGSEYRNVSIEDAEWVKPVLSGNRCEIFVKYPDREEPELYTGSQASGVLEYVLKRLITTPSDAMSRIFQQVESEKDLSHNGNGNGHAKTTTRRKRVLRNPEESRRRMSEAALRRWARQRQQEAQQATTVT